MHIYINLRNVKLKKRKKDSHLSYILDTRPREFVYASQGNLSVAKYSFVF